jgi:para-aminobenzoate synthetase component I
LNAGPPTSALHVREIAGLDPVEALRRLADRPNLTFLDSAAAGGALGRYSYLACDPFGSLEIADGRAAWNGERIDGDPWQALRLQLARYRQERRHDLPPFQGGAAGFFAYELNRTLERLPDAARPEPGARQAVLHFYDTVLAFDHLSGKSWIVSTGWPEQNPELRHRRAISRTDDLAALLARPAPSPAKRHGAALEWRSNFDRTGYVASVRRVIEAILDGDIFQANIAQRFAADLPPDFDPLAFYLRLRAINPAPFAALLRYGGLTVASSSPERFVKLDGRLAETRPIKGTIARDADASEDRRLAGILMASEKDRAENVMIVDLLRNDFSRICAPHTVEVPDLCALESFASVHHLVSTVTGRLADGQDVVALLRACFPGGSITGAPKKRAMEIIASIEQVPRGGYCGAIGFIGFDGGMDSNIAIRTVTMEHGRAVVHGGGGVTAMSDPEAEYDETLAKLGRIFAAFAPP